MTKTEELAHYERNKENNLRTIRAKIVHANAEQMALIAAFICGLGVAGWDDAEYNRPIKEKAEEAAQNEVL